MISCVILDSEEQEIQQICSFLREFTAYYTDEELKIKKAESSSRLLTELLAADLLDMAVIDVTLAGGLEAARKVRTLFPAAEILILADISVPPTKYMCPSIRAAALLLRPVSQGWEEAMQEFFLLLLADQRKKDQNQVLKIENREGIFRVPFDRICYLEAREKKVFIRTPSEELGIAGTMEKLSEILPENFKRCHRSFIVNTEQIMKISFRENLLYLQSGLFVPISRSYRHVFKEKPDE